MFIFFCVLFNFPPTRVWLVLSMGLGIFDLLEKGFGIDGNLDDNFDKNDELFFLLFAYADTAVLSLLLGFTWWKFLFLISEIELVDVLVLNVLDFPIGWVLFVLFGNLTLFVLCIIYIYYIKKY